MLRTFLGTRLMGSESALDTTASVASMGVHTSRPCWYSHVVLSLWQMDFWRGMRNRKVPDEFLERGGTELAPMSTTSNLVVAMQYSVS